MVQSNEFDPRVVLDTVEGQLCDRKETLYRILSNYVERGGFIKDVIALANSARQRGRRAYIIFGINNNREIVGIGDQDIKDPPRFTTPYTNDDSEVEKIQGEKIGRVMLQYIANYIGEFGVSYEYGFVGDKLVSYIVLPGRTPPKWHYAPYQTKRDITDNTGNILFPKGSCWARSGESNKVVSEEEKEGLYCHEIVPYVGAYNWSLYAQELTSSLSLEHSELLVPLWSISSFNGSIEDLFSAMSHCIEKRSIRNIIANLPGSGKTTSMIRMADKLAKDLLFEAKSTVDAETSSPIPIYFSLAGYSYSQQGPIKGLLLREIQRRGILLEIIDEHKFDLILRNKNLCFILFLDSFDEMDQQDALSRTAFQTLIDEMTNRVIIFVACRSNYTDRIPKSNTFQKIEIMPILERDIYTHIDYFTNMAVDFVDILQQEDELYDLIARPIGLEALRSYLQIASTGIQMIGDGVDHKIDSNELFAPNQKYLLSNEVESSIRSPVKVGDIIEKIISHTIRIEAIKHPFGGNQDTDLAVDHIRSQIEKVAFESLIKGDIPIKEIDRSLVEWCVRANILVIIKNKRPSSVRFSSALIRDYLAATYLIYQEIRVDSETLRIIPERVINFANELVRTLDPPETST